MKKIVEPLVFGEGSVVYKTKDLSDIIVVEMKNGKLGIVADPLLLRSCHLCKTCGDSFYQCQKVMDRKKKSIDHYPFIEEGYQVYKQVEVEKSAEEQLIEFDQGVTPEKISPKKKVYELDQFFVRRCRNYTICFR